MAFISLHIVTPSIKLNPYSRAFKAQPIYSESLYEALTSLLSSSNSLHMAESWPPTLPSQEDGIIFCCMDGASLRLLELWDKEGLDDGPESRRQVGTLYAGGDLPATSPQTMMANFFLVLWESLSA